MTGFPLDSGIKYLNSSNFCTTSNFNFSILQHYKFFVMRRSVALNCRIAIVITNEHGNHFRATVTSISAHVELYQSLLLSSSLILKQSIHAHNVAMERATITTYYNCPQSRKCNDKFITFIKNDKFIKQLGD